ncbi:hypothetical protein PFICI_14645 [Pestalotiopsis fici W106-1]|uniref:Uncharacterized protein n=1 Tax=Pestalotiopsis fici (strain W106-1 / CGMCC3.15140) TaxID=1229662 RepID=W3WIU3_PESFW|nr:uncharacterized protein PFICI_14645 [Pestalotiopsis fici W106-1]ETS73699.1 hypothetical protein PFICI_14645 [Pestalotiopsis fici W106-1]
MRDLFEKGTFNVDIARNDASHAVMKLADVGRFRELVLDETSLLRWADVAYGLQSMAIDYEPTGSVSVIDIFHAEPLRVAALSRDEWVHKQLSRWEDLCRSEPRFHEVGSGHYTMIGPEYVTSFAQRLRAALEARGI